MSMLDALRSLVPLPTIDANGTLYDGFRVAQPKKCRKCSDRSCVERLAELPTGLSHAVCAHGWSTALVTTPFGPLLINGIFVPNLNHSLDPEARKAARPNKVTSDELTTLADSLRRMETPFRDAMEQAASEVLAGVHDIQTAINLVYRKADALVQDAPGDSMEEKIANSDYKLRGLLVSVRLLKSRLELARLVKNPEAATYGRPRPMPIYKIFHRTVRLFGEEAELRRVSLRMNGESFIAPNLYDSFESIPLVLIDNATKYAEPDTVVNVSVDDYRDFCIAVVESYGQIVPDRDREAIFRLGYRSAGATRNASSGSGIGLYIAKIVADANRAKLSYESRLLRKADNYGVNRFIVRLDRAGSN
jgi:signal transduction histidine kinase